MIRTAGRRGAVQKAAGRITRIADRTGIARIATGHTIQIVDRMGIVRIATGLMILTAVSPEPDRTGTGPAALIAGRMDRANRMRIAIRQHTVGTTTAVALVDA